MSVVLEDRILLSASTVRVAFSQLSSGNEVNALDVEDSAVCIQTADDRDSFILIAPGPFLIIQLVRGIVSRLENILFTLAHDYAGDTLPGCLGPSLGLSGLLIGRRDGFRFRLGKRYRLLQV